MELGAQRLVGTHDFRNICKPDVNNGVRNFVRSVNRVSVEPSSSVPGMCVLTIAGKAFLWHQVRCVMALLVLVAQGKEEPDVISRLLDVDACPGKPQYSMAWEVPLCLFSCRYEGVEWRTDEASFKFVFRDLQRHWMEHSVR
jgi:tRNA pseudouridine38/39 synthase